MSVARDNSILNWCPSSSIRFTTILTVLLLLLLHTVPSPRNGAAIVEAQTEEPAEEEEDKKSASGEEQWLSDMQQFLDVADIRSDTIDNITHVFLTITSRLVKAGRLMIETKRRMIMFIHGIGEMSYDAKWALMGWVTVMFLFPIITAGIIAVIIALFFQTELTNLQIVLHTRWDVGDKPDIITESKAKQRLGNLAMYRLYHKMSRHPDKFLPKQGKRDPEAMIHEKAELPQPKEPGGASPPGGAPGGPPGGPPGGIPGGVGGAPPPPFPPPGGNPP